MLARMPPTGSTIACARAVSAKPRRLRRKSGSPIISRRRANAWLTAGWLSERRSAAIVTERERAISSNTTSKFKSIRLKFISCMKWIISIHLIYVTSWKTMALQEAIFQGARHVRFYGFAISVHDDRHMVPARSGRRDLSSCRPHEVGRPIDDGTGVRRRRIRPMVSLSDGVVGDPRRGRRARAFLFRLRRGFVAYRRHRRIRRSNRCPSHGLDSYDRHRRVACNAPLPPARSNRSDRGDYDRAHT